jgi:hypothetical protein
MSNKSIPFDKGYVLSTTLKHMIRAIDISIDKTSGRVQEFENNSEKSLEIIETLSELHSMRRAIKGLLNHKDK